MDLIRQIGKYKAYIMIKGVERMPGHYSHEQDVLEVTREIMDSSVNEFCAKDYFAGFSTERLDRLMELAITHKLFVVLNSYEYDSSSKRVFSIQKNMKTWCRLHWEELKCVTSSLSANNIQYTLVKGVALSQLLFDSSYVRGIGDIDIVVREDQMEQAFRLLQKMGYTRQKAKNLNDLVYFYGVTHHEIVLEKEIDNCKVYVELKRRTSCLPNDFNFWWPHVTSKIYDGVQLNILDENFEILHLILNSFSNNEIRGLYQNCYLRDYFDVAYAIKHVTFSWQDILNAAEQMEVTHQVATVLRSVKDIYPSVREQIEGVLDTIANAYCKYEEKPFYFGADKTEYTNLGLVPDRPRARLSYSIFDRDFSVYQFVKSYKAVIYSKRNPDYVYKQKLLPETSLSPQVYVNAGKIDATYYFSRVGAKFEVVVDIANSCEWVFDGNDCSITVLWYNNDINSPLLTTKCSSPMIKKIQELNWDFVTKAKLNTEYYSSEEYLQCIKKMTVPTVKITSSNYDDFTRIVFSFNQEELFFPLETVNFEVQFNYWIHGEEDIEVSLGSEENFIEWV